MNCQAWLLNLPVVENDISPFDFSDLFYAIVVRAVIIMALTDTIASDVESYLEVQSALYIANMAAALKTAKEETRASPTCMRR
jgi:hypothetical protein